MCRFHEPMLAVRPPSSYVRRLAKLGHMGLTGATEDERPARVPWRLNVYRPVVGWLVPGEIVEEGFSYVSP